jgi:hypothetical protein
MRFVLKLFLILSDCYVTRRLFSLPHWICTMLFLQSYV